jgi:hypothetical protein
LPDQHNAPELVKSAISASDGPEPVPSLISSDLSWTARQILAVWNRRDFVAAAKLLEQQLAAVEQGLVTSVGLQPDRRVLRHCIGVCASFSGNLIKAKYFFESAFNGIYLSRDLDEGDIAAARWLGDVCLQLREFHNTVLAWSVALEGSIRRYGISHDRTRHIIEEMHRLDEWVSAFGNINNQFLANVDPTDVFSNTHTLEKSDLVRAIQTRICESQSRWSQNKSNRPSAALRPRPRVDWVPGEAFLTGPLVSLGAWPLPWDSTFSPMAAYQMPWLQRIAKLSVPLVNRGLRTVSLGDSKTLDYVTKGDNTWLIETVKANLREMGVEHAEHPDQNSIVCSINRDRDGFACSDGVFISFWKLQFRNVYGLQISSVRWSTRKPPIDKPDFTVNRPVSSIHFGPAADTREFKSSIKEMLELAEAGVSSQAPIDVEVSVQSRTRSWKPWTSSKKASAST